MSRRIATIKPQFVTRENPYQLTNGEIRMMLRVVNGYTNLELQRMMGLSKHTIRQHMTTIYAKMKVRNRVEAAVKWVREQELERV